MYTKIREACTVLNKRHNITQGNIRWSK